MLPGVTQGSDSPPWADVELWTNLPEERNKNGYRDFVFVFNAVITSYLMSRIYLKNGSLTGQDRRNISGSTGCPVR